MNPPEESGFERLANATLCGRERTLIDTLLLDDFTTAWLAYRRRVNELGGQKLTAEVRADILEHSTKVVSLLTKLTTGRIDGNKSHKKGL